MHFSDGELPKGGGQAQWRALAPLAPCQNALTARAQSAPAGDAESLARRRPPMSATWTSWWDTSLTLNQPCNVSNERRQWSKKMRPPSYERTELAWVRPVGSTTVSGSP